MNVSDNIMPVAVAVASAVDVAVAVAVPARSNCLSVLP